MSVIERRDVYGFGAYWHPTLRAYALAIGRMREFPATDPRSLSYQASIHGFGPPGAAPPDDFRNQCQHNCWFFLPWHRWYLHYFERIVRSVLDEIDEVSPEVANSWALPYWNAGRLGGEKLPPEFATETLWNDQENPLYDATRRPQVNARTLAVDARQAVPGPGVFNRPFSDPLDNIPTFAGTESGWHHGREPGAVAGGVEGTPHNDVHGFVHGNMADFNTAGLDPIFWLHHCNVDRLWEVRGHQDDPANWATVTFAFRDEVANIHRQTADGCVDTVAQLGYQYDELLRPPGASVGMRLRERRMAVAPMAIHGDLPPESVGQSEGVRLEGATVESTIEIGRVSNAFRLARDGDIAPDRVFLTVSGITAPSDPGISYGVYLGDAKVDSHLAGLISFFGVGEAGPDAEGLAYCFDVTDIAQALTQEGAWTPESLPVLFVPIGGVPDEGTDGAEGTEPVDIGGVSIAFQ